MLRLTLYAATSNAGKLRDFAVAASAHDIAILPISVEIAPPAENADTFAGNAREKAVYYSRFQPGAIILADDSGLEVYALNGSPGVHSARYAADAGISDPADDSRQIDLRNNEFLLKQLAGVDDPARTARYRCVLAVARDGQPLLTAEGSVEGRLLTAARGTGGFGYDPLFYLPELGKTMAEVDLETKHALSHRGRAFRALLPRLAEL